MEQAQAARFAREMKALAKAATWDCESFAQAVKLQEDLADLLAESARTLNGQGFSWAEIAAPLGLGRNAVHKRYAK